MRAAQLSVAPEMAEVNRKPEYFVDKTPVQRYNYIHNTLRKICQTWTPAPGGIREGMQSVKLVIGTIDEGNFHSPVSLAFRLGSKIAPDSIMACWHVERRRYEEPVKDPSNSVYEKDIQTILVKMSDLTTTNEADYEARARKRSRVEHNLNLLAYSLEAYERRLHEASADAPKSRRQRINDEVTQAVLSILPAVD